MKNIKLDNREVKIRRVKLREVKEIIKDTATKVTEVADLFYNKKMADDEFLDGIPGFIIDNIEFFEGYLIKFTDLSQDELEDLEFLSVVELIKELIVYNGVSENFLKSFFHNFKEAKETVKTQTLVKEIPQMMTLGPEA